MVLLLLLLLLLLLPILLVFPFPRPALLRPSLLALSARKFTLLHERRRELHALS